MSKKCQLCGSNVPNEAKFCQVCGGSDFFVNNPQQTMDMNNNANPDLNQPSYNQNQYNQQPPVNQPWQPPVPQNQPKKKKTGLIIGIVVAVLIVLAGIGFIAEKVFQEQGYGNNGGTGNGSNNSFNIGGTNDSADEANKVEYTKGTFDGSVYQNEWADIKFALPEGFSNADAATYSAAESSNTEFGMYFMADDSMSLIYICYEKLPTSPVYDEEEYLDSAMKYLQNSSGITYKISDTYSSATIGGYAYTKAECEFNNGNGDFANNFYVRKLDNYMIVISATSVNHESNDALVSNITTAK